MLAESPLAEALRAARAVWPTVHVPDEAFAAYLREREIDVASSQATADLYLACACARGDAAAVAVFEAHYLVGLIGTLVSHDFPSAVAEDAVQSVREKLLCATPKIASYRGAGTLSGWVKVVAMREALQLLRKDRPAPAERQLAAMPLESVSPELEYLRKVYGAEFREAFAAVVGTLTRRERSVLRHYHVYGMSIDQIGAIYRVHRVTASRWVIRARTTLLVGVRKRLIKQLGVTPSELDSIMRLLESHLEVSLLQHLGSDDDMP